MKNVFGAILASLFVIVALQTHVIAKEWRGIVPLKSTRIEVERQFGKPHKASTSPSYYSLPGEIVVFHFQDGSCKGDVFGLGWNVPAGTVVAIGVIPKGTHRKEEYQLSKDAKASNNGAGFVYYSDNANGLNVETHNDVVTLVEYLPEARAEQLRCPQSQKCCYDLLFRFDEYDSLPFEDEKARLDNFMIYLDLDLLRGVLEVRGPSQEKRQKQMKNATRAKNYLVKERRLEAERLIIVDGGYAESSMTRLSIHAIGGLASGIYIVPQDGPE